MDDFFKLSKEKVERNTSYSIRKYESMKKAIQNYESDSWIERRQLEGKCKSCFYLKQTGSLQAFTKYNCHHCDSEEMHHNSAVPKYCKACSQQFNACVDCGAHIEANL